MNDIYNMPVSVFKTDGTVISYSYDHNGQRVKKAVGNASTCYLLGAGGEPFVVTDPAYSTQPTYYVHGRDLVGRVDRAGIDFAGHFFLKDHLGTIRTTVKGWESVLADNFPSMPINNWTVISGSGFLIESGELSASGSGAENQVINSNAKVITDGLITVDFKNITSTYDEASVLVRYQDVSNFYMVSASFNQVAIKERYLGGYQTRATGSLGETIVTGQWYQLQVKVQGNKIEVYWKGQKKAEWTDTVNPWTSGRVGLRQGSSQHVHWDNFVAVTSVTPVVVSYDDVDAWGMVLGGRSGNAGDGRQRYKFTGKERDTESGYDYFGARYYDPRVGRWVSVDPLSARYPESSTYCYVGLNPITRIDPDGRVWNVVAGAVGALVGSAAGFIANLSEQKASGKQVDYDKALAYAAGGAVGGGLAGLTMGASLAVAGTQGLLSQKGWLPVGLPRQLEGLWRGDSADRK
jgi:RHS repeat-associated protein